jgi:hypothetical protein
MGETSSLFSDFFLEFLVTQNELWIRFQVNSRHMCNLDRLITVRKEFIMQ